MIRCALVPLLAVLLLACSSTPEVDPRYQPSASVLEVIAVLRHHVPDDTYRFEPARDFTGRNVYRSSLLRLESLERAYEPALRAGHMDGVIAFAKGRALERLRAFDLAAGEYRVAAEREKSLRDEAWRSADICSAIDRLLRTTAVLPAAVGDPDPDPEAEPTPLPPPDVALERFEARATGIEELSRAAQGTHHAFVLLEEMERTDMDRAHYFASQRYAIPQGDVRAVAELQRVAIRHRESKLAARHLLDLADFYADLSEEYVDEHPPEGLTFDPAEFRDLVDSGARLYEMVAARDGTPEKVEAARRLEAFLAFSLRVDRDRFTP